MKNRPDFVKCIKKNNGETLSWCGREISTEWHFSDIDHAALNGDKGGRLVACFECVNAITRSLNNGNELRLNAKHDELKNIRIAELESALKSALDMHGHFDRPDYGDAFENIRNILDKKEPTA